MSITSSTKIIINDEAALPSARFLKSYLEKFYGISTMVVGPSSKPAGKGVKEFKENVQKGGAIFLNILNTDSSLFDPANPAGTTEQSGYRLKVDGSIAELTGNYRQGLVLCCANTYSDVPRREKDCCRRGGCSLC